MTMLFNLNWRNDGGMVMQEPSLSHISSQLRTRPSIQLSQLSSSGTGQKETVIHIRQDLAIEGDEVCPGFLCARYMGSINQLMHVLLSNTSTRRKPYARYESAYPASDRSRAIDCSREIMSTFR